MKTMFRSKKLWNIVDKGFSEDGEPQEVEELQAQDACALYLIQHSLDERTLVRIADASSSKQAAYRVPK